MPAPLPTNVDFSAPPPVSDPTTGQVLPNTPLPGEPEGGSTLTHAIQGVGTALEVSPLAAYKPMEPGAADAGAPVASGQGPLVDMQPGHADSQPTPDLYPNENDQTVSVIRPGTKGGFQATGKTIEGVSPESRDELAGMQDKTSDLKRSADEEANAAQQRYVDQVNDQATRQYQDNQAMDLANAAELARNQMVQARVQDKMADVAKFKPNREQMFEGTVGGFRALGAVVGMLFGGALSGLTGQRNQAQDVVFKMIDDNVSEQVRQNSAVYQDLKQRLGDEQAAAIALRQKHLEFAKNIMDAQLLGRQAQQAQAALGGAKQRTELEISDAALKLQERLVPHEKLALAHVAPTPTQILTLDKQEMMLKQYGVTPETRQKFMLQKVGGGDAAPDVGTVIQNIKETRRDVNTLRAIQKEWGGTLPGKDGVLDFNRTGFLRSLGARLGFQGSVAASEVYAKIQKNALQRAKALGGAVTKSDLESIGETMGQTGDQIIQSMEDSADRSNAQIASVANAYFGGNAQHVVDIMSAGIAGTPGLRTQGITPRP